ncbi:MBL fold metallo-hydrolase [Herbiconiux sp. L3-i23]|uniref:MBL fold metallo-hydrolase n=1 Tax=Herbiconiux sp. L3-i23 TaxID=2905871 RepID=UPI002061881E|nr:MBL fold metallo-hydrolase [Herbiconiux sp. L3-i23]BDI22480.1 MBL fold metallo-hydrolase [Herbiconiux sp. L3-i23]
MTVGNRTGGRRARAGDAVLTRNVAPGVHRLAHAFVNCYLLVEGDEVTIVDAALPKTWALLPAALEAIGADRRAVKALVLTHAHFDHLGFARRMHEQWRVPVFGHPIEDYIAAHPYRYAHENPRAIYPIAHPRGIPILTRMAAAGAFGVRGIESLRGFAPGDVLPVPGSPRVVFSPGHTYGHSALHLPERDALLSGDALVTLDPYTGRTGPRIVAGAATADSALALASLDALAATEARIVLPGHGEPWRAGVRSAVALARSAGRA